MCEPALRPPDSSTARLPVPPFRLAYVFYLQKLGSPNDANSGKLQGFSHAQDSCANRFLHLQPFVVSRFFPILQIPRIILKSIAQAKVRHAPVFYPHPASPYDDRTRVTPFSPPPDQIQRAFQTRSFCASVISNSINAGGSHFLSLCPPDVSRPEVRAQIRRLFASPLDVFVHPGPALSAWTPFQKPSFSAH